MSLLLSTLPLSPAHQSPHMMKFFANSQTCSEFQMLRTCNLFSDYFYYSYWIIGEPYSS